MHGKGPLARNRGEDGTVSTVQWKRNPLWHGEVVAPPGTCGPAAILSTMAWCRQLRGWSQTHPVRGMSSPAGAICVVVHSHDRASRSRGSFDRHGGQRPVVFGAQSLRRPGGGRRQGQPVSPGAGGAFCWDGLDIHEYPEWGGILKRLGVSPSMRRALTRVAAAGPMIVHNHSLWMMPNVYPGFAVRGTTARLVTSPRGVFDPWARRHSRWRKAVMMVLLQHQTLDRTDCFHATSVAEHESIRGSGLRAPVAVIPNGINVPALSKPVVRDGPWRLVFLGRLHPKKGVDVLLARGAPCAGDFQLGASHFRTR